MQWPYLHHHHHNTIVFPYYLLYQVCNLSRVIFNVVNTMMDLFTCFCVVSVLVGLHRKMLEADDMENAVDTLFSKSLNPECLASNTVVGTNEQT